VARLPEWACNLPAWAAATATNYPATLRGKDSRRHLFSKNWKRLAPVTLPAEQPVAQLVIDGFLAEPFSSSHAVIFFLASVVGKPFNEISELDEFTARPSFTSG
jgi:hypothetical protein